MESSSQAPSQFAFYSERDLFPSRAAIDSAQKLDAYAAIRRNLYERMLHLPVGWLKGRKVLDLGCGTGDSALVLARAGAALTLVDADDRVWPVLAAAFDRFGLHGQIAATATAPAEQYRPTDTFALIMAEGFLFTCKNRVGVARRLFRALEPDGFLSISFPDELGSFMEFLKKAAFRRGCALRGIDDLFGDEAAEIGSLLLGEAHAALPNPRPFRVWLHDCIGSPFLDLRLCWSHPALLAALARDGAVYYSSSPSICEPDRLGWYKNVITDRARNAQALAGYSTRAGDFIFGQPVRFLQPRTAAAFASATKNFLTELSDWFAAPSRKPPRPSRAWFSAIEASDLPRGLVREMPLYFGALAETKWSDFIRGMRRARHVLACWGKSYHYLVVRRPVGDT